MTTERRFRIMGGPSLPWSLVEPYDDNAKNNHDQTLEELNRRGGLAPGELWCVVHGKRLRELPKDEAVLPWLHQWLADYETRTFAAERDQLRELLGDVKFYLSRQDIRAIGGAVNMLDVINPALRERIDAALVDQERSK
jgi:hypothetical protein